MGRRFRPTKISSSLKGAEQEKITRSPHLLWTLIFQNPLREYISYYQSITFAFKGQKILGVSQDQHSPAPRESGWTERGGLSCGRVDRQERRRRSKRKRPKPFSISQRDYMGHRASLPFVLLWFLSLLGDFGRERERERPHGYLCLPRPLCVTPCSSFISRLDRERRERDSHFKRQFDLRSTQEHNLKEDLRKQLKGEHKGHTVTDAGQWNLAVPESVQRRNSC